MNLEREVNMSSKGNQENGNLVHLFNKSINPKVSARCKGQKPFANYNAPRDLSRDEVDELLIATFTMGNRLFFDDSKPNPRPGFIHSYSLRFIVLDNYLTSKTSKELQRVSEHLDSLVVGVNLRA